MAQMALPHPLPAEYARTVADRFRLLGDPSRLMLMDLLRDGERTVGSLAAELGCTQANASKHLGLLADGGLLSRRREGREHHCRVLPAPMRTASEWIARYEKFWEGRLDALALYLEETANEEKPRAGARPRRRRRGR